MIGSAIVTALGGFVPVLAFCMQSNAVIYYCLAAILAVAVLLGISRMSKVETAVSGNLMGACSMGLAILLTLWYFEIFTLWDLWLAMACGTVLGLILSAKIKMIEMPQMVGLLNGFGGLASMIAGMLSIWNNKGESNAFSLVTAGLAIVVGGLTWSGSAVAAAKLHRLMNQRPIVWKNHQAITTVLLILSLITVPLFAVAPFVADGPYRTSLILAAVLLSNAFGYVFAIRVGGADMPITISLLNSFSGVAGAIAGMAISDLLLVAVGGIVGASGLLLTQIMCRSMNRHLMDILLGKTASPAGGKIRGGAGAAPLKTGAASGVASSDSSAEAGTDKAGKDKAGKAGVGADDTKVADPASWLAEAKKVVIVPGYGMALSQAQPLVKQVCDDLEAEGKEVVFAIHPVAGRMPGHMNVLLAEVNIPYEKLKEMQDINDSFSETDVALVVGANDVINPAANTAEGTPIYGMPVLNVAQAKHVIICNFDEKPGYAGVENPLYREAKEEAKTGKGTRVVLRLGDAKESLRGLLKEYHAALQGQGSSAGKAGARTGAGAQGKPNAVPLSPEDRYGAWLNEAKKVVIVPGYGMALSQAQPLVKQLSDELESEGKEVNFAIHPVAGRMPGHMNVLLAEVDVPYDKLKEMQEIDSKFKETDLVIVIGANDVINPAANTAEGTPIYGMPVLSVHDAKHIVILNFDLKPGYAGVENPLYAEAQEDQDHVILELGDAKESLKKLQKAFRAAQAGATAQAHATGSSQEGQDAGSASLSPEDRYGAWLNEAKKVVIVPGYGMALSQAQPLVKQLSDELESEGKEVNFAIHPVAGRMPGHMNVLLAEVDVPYDKLKEMQEIDSKFKETDLVIVIGANDVINPAANTAEGTPIYGMPVLSVHDAKHIVILNFDLKPGYAGVENPLYAEAQEDQDHVILELGDAKESLKKLQKAFRAAQAGTRDLAGSTAQAKGAAGNGKASNKESKAQAGTPVPKDLTEAAELAGSFLKEAQSVIIVPGYGMALSQAQPLVKQLADDLEAEGKSLDFAIHPVAGRMPGHMNVLLAEVNVPYEKLREMEDVNPTFAQTDVALVIGANDVINPAANTAEGTPIYGMPVLDVEAAKKVVILNFDLKPGYAGVENPLYAQAQESADKVVLLLGDAKESLKLLLKALRK